MIDHPYHVSTYFNASRSNGIGFLGSVPLTLVGSLMWECCGERHPMAFNDVVNTTLGGIALGEAKLGPASSVVTRIQGGAILFGTLDSALRPAVEVPSGWSLRPFDYTTGLDGRIEAEASVGRFRGGAAWRSSWMASVNQSSLNGGKADHWVHQGRVSGYLGLGQQLGIGADFRLYLRNSSYSIDLFEGVQETVPEVRIFGTWVIVPGRDGAAPGFF